MTALPDPESERTIEEEFESDVLDMAGWFFSMLVPDSEMTVSEWADRHRFLSTKASAEAGQWRTSRTPYLREIMDNLSAMSPVQETDVQAGAQVGKTEAGLNWSGYTMDVSPCPMLFVLPTVDIAKRSSNQRLGPLINDSPRLKEKVAENKSRDSKNTILTKDFPGGTMMLTGANSAAGLRSMPIKNLYGDEIDAYPLDVDGEGDPIELARARTRTFARRKILFTSTPTTKKDSRIAQLVDETDRRLYHMPCPHCGNMDFFKWANFRIPKFENGEYDFKNAHIVCEACEGRIDNHHKTEMMREKGFGGLAEWIPSAPEKINPKRRGYHLSALYSPVGFFSWSEIAEQWIHAQGNPLKLKEFVNTVLAETWEEQGERVDHTGLSDRCEIIDEYQLPAGCHIITIGADVQRDRIECEIVGWGRGEESWSLGYFVLDGDPNEDSVWGLLDSVRDRVWLHASGVQVRAFRTFVDSGNGSHTSRIYDYCRPRAPMGVFACKGSSLPKQVVCGEKSFQKKAGVDIYMIGTVSCKDLIYGRLGLSVGSPGSMHFPVGRDQSWFEQLTAEEAKYKSGVKVYVKIRLRNEALDCRVYALGALYSIGIKVDDIANSFDQMPQKKERVMHEL